MLIRKLTLAPIVKGYPNIVIETPTVESAITLITQRLKCNRTMPGDDTRYPKHLRKLPKSIRGLVNPATRVINNNNHNFATLV